MFDYARYVSGLDFHAVTDVDMVVTEFGVAELRGRSLRERAQALIAIAHPKFRDGLQREARERGLGPR